MRSDAIRPGDVIGGKYNVRAILSRTRGFLVEAFHAELAQRVVVRVLSPHLVDDREVERFRREAQTFARLESDHAARILDVGRTEDGAFFFARQYLEGQDLGSHLAQRGPLPLAEAVLYVLQAAEAVAETHVHGIVLRELQPAHLFLTQRLGGQHVKVIDFGTAKLMRDGAASAGGGGEQTTTSTFGLTCYSSPELVRRAPNVDVRTDVWSLGAILYQLLAGRPPFAGEMASLMLAITREEPVPITRYRRDLPPDFDNIIAWSLAKDPGGRFANVYGFAHALLPFAPPEGQVLVKRIGEITTAGEQRRIPPAPVSAPAAVDIKDPVTMDVANLVDDEDDDEPRTAYRAPDAPAVRPDYHGNLAPAAPAAPAAAPEGNPLDRTMFIPQGEPGPSPISPAAAGRAAQPLAGAVPAAPASQPYSMQPAEPHPGRPAWQPMPVPLPAGGSVGFGVPGDPGSPPAYPSGPGQPGGYPAAPGQPGGPSQVPVAPASASRPRAIPRSAMLTIQSSSVPGSRAASPPRAQKMALAAVAAAVVLLSVVAVLVVFKARPANDGTAETTPMAASAAVGSAPTTSAARATGAPSGSAAAPPDEGTLVAVVVGGSCAFSVDGASKGTASTLKLTVKPGTYSVTCAPRVGLSKSKSVTVTGGATATAMFNL
jgi:serine/threonine-protein kinase